MIRIAGVVTGRQRPGTASGVVFLTLEDETGNTNMVIWATVMERFRAVLLQGQLLKFKGIVEREGRVIHVVAGHVEDAGSPATFINGALSIRLRGPAPSCARGSGLLAAASALTARVRVVLRRYLRLGHMAVIPQGGEAEKHFVHGL